MPATAKSPNKPPSKVAGVGDAIEQLERRRRRGQPKRATGRRADLDLDGIR